MLRSTGALRKPVKGISRESVVHSNRTPKRPRRLPSKNSPFALDDTETVETLARNERMHKQFLELKLFSEKKNICNLKIFSLFLNAVINKSSMCFCALKSLVTGR